ncbi:hypothetical protein Pan216_21590 [Planctomycetes bacterium Pan216]|uniref:Uncharacterized protein n=1 Tax=Kolteria novifilia TaxID=2527975 RepID=A0A518B2Z4_9BACT|nr:hypothetical protein Pan216_21590 [Planctomycetes bacterium Pan216]
MFDFDALSKKVDALRQLRDEAHALGDEAEQVANAPPETLQHGQTIMESSFQDRVKSLQERIEQAFKMPIKKAPPPPKPKVPAEEPPKLAGPEETPDWYRWLGLDDQVEPVGDRTDIRSFESWVDTDSTPGRELTSDHKLTNRGGASAVPLSSDDETTVEPIDASAGHFHLESWAASQGDSTVDESLPAEDDPRLKSRDRWTSWLNKAIQDSSDVDPEEKPPSGDEKS